MLPPGCIPHTSLSYVLNPLEYFKISKWTMVQEIWHAFYNMDKVLNAYLFNDDLFEVIYRLDFDVALSIFARTNFVWRVRLLCGVSLRPLLLAFCISFMIMSLVNTQHLPCCIDHETNPSGPWSQATNGKIFEELSWNLKWFLGMGLEKKSQVLRALGVSFRLAVHSGNTYKHVLSNWLESGRLALWALGWPVWGR